MWAGGGGISRGYVGLPEKTAERYKLDPFTNDGLVSLLRLKRCVSCLIRSYMFNTGDLGRWRPDGTLEHLGRIDDQVKVKVCSLTRSLYVPSSYFVGFPCRVGWSVGRYAGMSLVFL